MFVVEGMENTVPDFATLGWEVLDTLPDLLVVLNGSGEVVWCSRAAAELAGAPRINLIGSRFENAWGKSGSLAKPVRAVQVGSATYSLLSLSTAVPSDSERLLEGLSAFVWSFDVVTATFVEASPSAVTALGYSSVALFAPGFLRQIVHPTDELPLFESLELILRERKPRDIAIKLYTITGKPVWAQGTVLPHPQNLPGLVTGCFFVGDNFRLMREQVRDAQEQVLFTEKVEALSLLAGGIAHEFNNALQVIQGNASLALMDLKPEDRAHRFLKHVEKSSEQAVATARELLLFSGRRHPRLDPVHLSALVGEQMESLKAQVGPQVLLHFNAAPGLPVVEGDRDLLREALRLMVENSRDSLAPGGGMIQVRTGVALSEGPAPANCFLAQHYREGLSVYLEVSDNGAGYSESSRRRLFDPYYSTRGRSKGAGLAQVIAIARGHSGFLRVATEPGKGCAMRLHLNLPERSRAVVVPERPLGDRGSKPAEIKPTVLLADRDVAVLEVASSILARAGYPVLTARSEEEVMRHFSEQDGVIGLLVLDLHLPQRGPESLFRRLRERHPELPILFTSGVPGTESPSGAGPRTDFAAKPFSPRELQQKLGKLFESARPEK